MRRRENEAVSIALERRPQGTRPRGRPKKDGLMW